MSEDGIVSHFATSTSLCFSDRDEKSFLIQDLRDDLESGKVTCEELVRVAGLQLAFLIVFVNIRYNTVQKNLSEQTLE